MLTTVLRMSQEKRTNILITLAGRAADPLRPHSCRQEPAISPAVQPPKQCYEVHAHEMHACEIHAYEMQMTPIRYTPMRHAREMHAYAMRCTPMRCIPMKCVSMRCM